VVRDNISVPSSRGHGVFSRNVGKQVPTGAAYHFGREKASNETFLPGGGKQVIRPSQGVQSKGSGYKYFFLNLFSARNKFLDY
jgi:hypothetical protein